MSSISAFASRRAGDSPAYCWPRSWYQSRIASPQNSAITPPSARNGPSGIDCLRASLPCRTKRMHGRDERDEEPDEHRDDDRDPEPGAQEGRELDVAHAEPARVDRGRSGTGRSRRRAHTRIHSRLGSSIVRRARTTTAPGRMTLSGISLVSKSVRVTITSTQQKTAAASSLERETEHEAARAAEHVPFRATTSQRRRRPRNRLQERIVERRVRRKAIGEWAHDEPGEQPDETGTDVHATRFPDERRLPAARAAREPFRLRPGDGHPSIWGGMTAASRTTVGCNCGGPGRGRTAARVNDESRRRQLRSTFVWALVPGHARARRELRDGAPARDARLRHRHARRLRLRRRRGRRLLNLRVNSAHSEARPRPADRPAEPRPARRPHRAGVQPLTAVGRALHAHRDRPRRLQGRQRRARSSRRRPRAEDARAPVRGGSPRGGHRRPRRRRRVRGALDGNRRDDRASALVGRLRNALRRPFKVEAQPSRSTGASAGPSTRTTARRRRISSRTRRRSDVRDEARHERRDAGAPPRRRRGRRPRRRDGARAERAPRRLPAHHRPRDRDARTPPRR